MRNRDCRQLINALVDGFALQEIIVDDAGKPIDYRFLEVNPAFERITGLKHDFVIGKTVREVLPNIEPFWIKAYGQVALSGRYQRFEKYESDLGRYFEILAFSPRKGQFATIFTDITERKAAEEDLMKEKALLDAIMENIPDSIYFKDDACRLVRINRKMLDSLHGYTMTQVIGKTDVDLFGEEFGRLTLCDDQRLLSGGEPIVGRIEGRPLADGGSNWTSTTKVAMRDPNGQITGLVGITREINELMRAQEEREVERNLFLTLMDNIPDRIYFKDSQGRFTEINRALARHFGLKEPEEAIGKTDFDFFAERHARQAFEDERMIMSSGTPLVGTEEREEWPDGRVGWVSTTKMPLRDKQGRIVGTFGVSRDITKGKQAEEALSQAEQKYRSISENSLQGIYQSTPDGRFLFANPALARMLGYESPEDLITRVTDIGRQ
ncbi:MAG TPA: PAS domain S-box protein, partial [Bacteroidota bacterium]|nr:PAS domain S-box protein [Bacteroidota bacterium]